MTMDIGGLIAFLTLLSAGVGAWVVMSGRVTRLEADRDNLKNEVAELKQVTKDNGKLLQKIANKLDVE